MIPHPCENGPRRTPCKRIRLGEAWTTDQCRACWLFAHDSNFNRLYGGDGEITEAPGAPIHMRPAVPPLDHGPGTELVKLLESLGIKGELGCDCKTKAFQMDQWGVEGCKERRAEIVGWLRNNAARRGWMEKAKAAALALVKGVAFSLDASDPYGSLVDLAIQRAADHNPDSRAVLTK